MKLPESFTKITPFSKLLSGILFILLPLIGFYLGYKCHENITSKQTRTIITKNISNKKIISIPPSTPTIQIQPTPTIILPKITERIKGSIDISSWQSFKDKRGYVVNYPADWFIVEHDGEIGQIQNFDPKRFEIPLPLALPKWDVSFYLENYRDIDDLLAKTTTDMNVEKIEKSTTSDGLECYLIQGTGSSFIEKDPISVLRAIVLDQNKYFIWNGFYFGNEILEILKQIVESIRK